MIYILHGDDIVTSRKKLSELTSEFKSVTYLDAEKIGNTDIVQTLSSSDLFLDKKCIVIEKILKLPKKELDALLELVDSFDSSITLILWNNTELSKVFLGKFKDATIESFILPKLFFTFLDNLSPNSVSQEIELLSRMVNVEAEQIFYAMIKRIRNMLMIKSNSNSDDLTKMSPWQLGKIKEQSLKWKVEELEKIYKDLFDLEVKMKSGGLMLPLKKHLDILLVQAIN